MNRYKSVTIVRAVVNLHWIMQIREKHFSGQKKPAPGHMTAVSIPSQLVAFVQCTNCTTVYDCTLMWEHGPSICPSIGNFPEELGLKQSLKEAALSLGHGRWEEVGCLFWWKNYKDLLGSCSLSLSPNSWVNNLLATVGTNPTVERKERRIWECIEWISSPFSFIMLPHGCQAQLFVFLISIMSAEFTWWWNCVPGFRLLPSPVVAFPSMEFYLNVGLGPWGPGTRMLWFFCYHWPSWLSGSVHAFRHPPHWLLTAGLTCLGDILAQVLILELQILFMFLPYESISWF